MRTGERRDVDDVRRALALGPGHRVGEDQPALGIGVRDLDGHPVHRLHHVAGALRVAAGHVLDHRRDGHERRLGRQPGDRPGRGDHRRGAGLVVLHVPHPIGGLEADAAGVEADALPDDREAPVAAVLPARQLDPR